MKLRAATPCLPPPRSSVFVPPCFEEISGLENDISEGRIGRGDGRDIGAIYGTVSASRM